MIDFYNQQIGSEDKTKISWTRALKNDLSKGVEYEFGAMAFVKSTYRPFTKQYLYYHRPFIECPGLWQHLYPTTQYNNLVIAVSRVGQQKTFSSIITSNISDLQLVDKAQYFPLYYYEENKNQTATLFDDAESTKYTRRDGITDWILKEVRNRFGGSKAITKEHIFYYVYGLLHSKQYRERFADDLKKSLPRIPIVDNVQDFMAFYKAGKELADLHLNYEQDINKQTEELEGDYQPCAALPMAAYRAYGIKVNIDWDLWHADPPELFYSYFDVTKMRFAKIRDKNGKLVADKTRIIYNENITVENIPLKAYEYIVNGKPAIEWIMERYAVTIDKASLIKNDPNDWSLEQDQPRYILDLLLSVILLSCKTVDIVESLPVLKI